MINRKIVNIIIIVLLSFSSLVSLTSLNTIALYGAIPLSFILSFMIYHRFFSNRYFKIFIILYLWILFTALFAQYMEPVKSQLHQMLGVFLVSYVLSVIDKNTKMISWLYGIYIILLFGALYYAYNNIISVISIGEERLNDDLLDANVLAYYLFFATTAVFMIGEFIVSNVIKKIFRIFFWMMIPLSFYVAILTASRQVLLIQIPLITFFIWYRYFWGSKLRNKLLIIFIILFLIVLFGNSIWEIYTDSLLYSRSQINVKDDSRYSLALEALEVGFNHFFVGVGPGNYYLYTQSKHFAHNTFLELFANTGFIGAILYIYMLLSFIISQVKRFMLIKDRKYLLFSFIGIVFFIDQFFYVYYNRLWLMSFFILVSSHCEYYYSSRKTNTMKYM